MHQATRALPIGCDYLSNSRDGGVAGNSRQEFRFSALGAIFV